MTARISRRRGPQWVAALVIAIFFLVGWWIEQHAVDDPAWQRPAGSLPEGLYRIERVVDGDTLLLELDHTRARLQGIDTPETVKEDTPVERWGPEATAYTKRFLGEAEWQVRIECDGEAEDRFGRKLVFVWLGDRLLNEELVREGLAKAKLTYDYSATKKDRLADAQEDARFHRRGIWSRD